MTSDIEGNQAILGDCLEKMKDIPDKSVDMILTDLPYGVTSRNKWDEIIPTEPLFRELKRICRGTIVMTAINPFASELVVKNKDIFKYNMVWKKERASNYLNAKKQPLPITELILVFYDKLKTYNPQMKMLEKPYTHALVKYGSSNFGKVHSHDDKDRKYKTYTHSYPTNLLEIPREHNTKNIHPTQKPVALFEYLIKTYTNEGNTVLDCCAGSGTTAIACMNTNRNYICIEKDEGYFKIMQDRIVNSPKSLEVFSQ